MDGLQSTGHQLDSPRGSLIRVTALTPGRDQFSRPVLDLLPILLNQLKEPLREHFHGFAVEQQTVRQLLWACEIRWAIHR